MFLGCEGKVDPWASLGKEATQSDGLEDQDEPGGMDVGTGADVILQEGVSVVESSNST